MAYLDRQLPEKEAARVGDHLNACAECRALAEELRQVSERTQQWRMEPAPASLAQGVNAAMAELQVSKTGVGNVQPLTPVWRRRWFGPVWKAAAICVAAMILVSISIPNLLRSKQSARLYSTMPTEGFRGTVSKAPAPAFPDVDPQRRSDLAQAASAGDKTLPAGPMLIHRITLVVVTRQFDKAQAEVQRIVGAERGYFALLSVVSPENSGRRLEATLRVPADRLDLTLSELRKLGRVEQETQSSEEVSRQYIDLVARLSNARTTEQRLQAILRERTGKVTDILAVEKEMARVREEIERMEADRKHLENQVNYATIDLRLTEEYRAQFQVTPPSVATRLWNDLIEGGRGALSNVIEIISFLLAYGPTILLWIALLFFPARFAWRKWIAPRRA